MNLKFYTCEHCGNTIMFIKNSGVPVICCGEEMKEIIPGIVDASAEKHVPVISIKDNKVTVTIGEVEHPMEEAHYIEWILLQTTNGNQIKYLNPKDSPSAEFLISESEEVIAAYEYCNLHGLWKKEK